MITGKTQSGFEFRIEEEVFDDAELTDMLVAIDEGEGQYIGKVLTAVLGKEQKAKLYDFCRENGKTKLSRVAVEFRDIFVEAGKKKS